MPYVLGIDIGAGTTKAAVCRRADGTGPGWGPAQPVTLGARSRTVGSTLTMTPEGDVVPADLLRPPADGVGGYLRRVGDSLPMLFGGDYFPAHGLVAAMARWVVDRVWQQLDEPPERIAVAYPSGWGNGRLHLVHSALGEADLAQTALVTRARAVVESHQAAGRVPAAGGMLLAYRIGGSTCEVTVAVPHGPGRLELLGSAELDEMSGFDVGDASPTDARAVIQSTVDLAMHTVRSCGAAPGDLSAVLIAGGSGAVYPYVSDLLSAAFPVPILRDSDPAMTVAAGAALAVRPQVRRPAPPPGAALGGPIASGPMPGRPIFGGQMLGGLNAVGPMRGGSNPVGPMHGGSNPVGPMHDGPMQGGSMQGGPMQGGPMQGGPNVGGPMHGGSDAVGPMHGGPVPAELTESPELPGMAVLPTDSWPEIASAGGAVTRPPRPPVAVATVRAGGR